MGVPLLEMRRICSMSTRAAYHQYHRLDSTCGKSMADKKSSVRLASTQILFFFLSSIEERKKKRNPCRALEFGHFLAAMDFPHVLSDRPGRSHDETLSHDQGKR